MSKKKEITDSRNTQWHMALPPAIKLELMEYKQILEYVPEYLLNPMALKVDLLVIKKADDTVIKNDIAHIFKGNNIIEYKSPHDVVGVDTYFKVYAYASLYKIGKDGKTYEPEDVTITIMRKAKPIKLFKWFRQHGCQVEEYRRGIYYIIGAGFFETQVIVMKELDAEMHIWLTSLTDSMDSAQAKTLILKSGRMLDKPEAEYVEALLQVVSKANREIFDKVKKEDEGMYSAFIELMQPEIDAAVNEAVSEAVNKAVEKTWHEAVNETTNKITAEKTVEAVENAMKKLKMSKKDACAFMDITVEEYEAYKKEQ